MRARLMQEIALTDAVIGAVDEVLAPAKPMSAVLKGCDIWLAIGFGIKAAFDGPTFITDASQTVIDAAIVAKLQANNMTVTPAAIAGRGTIPVGTADSLVTDPTDPGITLSYYTLLFFESNLVTLNA